ncbi:MAG: phosphate/phosphite/phosphonate ABC transporter substrate-binding protein [Nitrospirae bacterium]|nr:phosphate/phosphite/phosphonate ABC transporter substrate-binding protein [Nitrospirota bacterium]
MKQCTLYCLASVFFLFLSLPVSETAAAEPLKLGIHPYLAATELHKRFTPLVEYFEKKLGRKVSIVITRDYQDQIDSIGRDALDIAFMGPSEYVKMVTIYGRKPLLARIENKGKGYFHGMIFVKKDSSIKTLRDLRGKKFAFCDKNSTMTRVPLQMLWKAGVTLDQIDTYNFLDKHENVALGVLAGDFDAGAVKDEIFAKYESRGLRVLERTPDISEHIFVTSNKLPEQTVTILRKALYELKNSPEGIAIMTSIKEGLTAIGQVEDKDYDNLRTILDDLKKIKELKKMSIE